MIRQTPLRQNDNFSTSKKSASNGLTANGKTPAAIIRSRGLKDITNRTPAASSKTPGMKSLIKQNVKTQKQSKLLVKKTDVDDVEVEYMPPSVDVKLLDDPEMDEYRLDMNIFKQRPIQLSSHKTYEGDHEEEEEEQKTNLSIKYEHEDDEDLETFLAGLNLNVDMDELLFNDVI